MFMFTVARLQKLSAHSYAVAGGLRAGLLNINFNVMRMTFNK